MRIAAIKAYRVELPLREVRYRRGLGVEPLAEVPVAKGIG
jgi:hypothetical protein